MSYAQFGNAGRIGSGGGITPIESLPELSDLEGSQGVGAPSGMGLPQGVGPPPGMGSGPHGPDGYIQQHLPPGEVGKYQRVIRGRHVPPEVSGMTPPHHPPPQEFSEQIITPSAPNQIVDPLHDISCLDVARHIQECPICSKFYNGDRTIYIIIIIVLAVVCLLLLKRVLNV